jgi:ketosteroid isomerase-like protein
MEERSALETVELLVQSMKGKDYENAAALFDPNIVIIEPDSVPYYPGTHRGLLAVQRDLFGPLLAHYDLTVNEGTKVHDAGDVVLGTLDLTFTSRATGVSL